MLIYQYIHRETHILQVADPQLSIQSFANPNTATSQATYESYMDPQIHVPQYLQFLAMAPLLFDDCDEQAADIFRRRLLEACGMDVTKYTKAMAIALTDKPVLLTGRAERCIESSLEDMRTSGVAQELQDSLRLDLQRYREGRFGQRRISYWVEASTSDARGS